MRRFPKPLLLLCALAACSPARMQEDYYTHLSQHISGFRFYPPGVHGLEGESVVAFRVNCSGHLVDMGLSRSSGYPVLDQAALQTVERANPFPLPPQPCVKGLYKFLMPIHFRVKRAGE